MYDVYVYYHVNPRHADEAETPIRALMARIRCRTGVTAQLQQKFREPLLWMESYTGVIDPDAFTVELARTVAEYDVDVFIDGERHMECFAPIT